MAAPQPVASPRRSRGFSLKSENSHNSNNSGKNKTHHRTESAEEKAKRNLHTKADPMVAMSEAQPMTVALEKSNLGSLRDMEHKDQYGNAITEPDLSNPTRPRFERPLDTIRSFEAAIYGTYSSRPVSYAKTDYEPTPGPDYTSRRSSYFGAPNGHLNRGYSEQGAYHNGRGTYSRPDSFVDNYGDGPPPENHYPYNQGGRRPRRHPRMNSEHAMYGQNYGQNGYAPNGHSQNGYHKSYENVTAASGSGSNTDQWGNSTDPSSVNSSIDQLQQQQQIQRMEERAMAENYGFQGFGPGPNLEGQAMSGAAGPAPGRINLSKDSPATDPTAGGPVGGPVGGPSAATAAPTRRHLRKATNASDVSDTNTKRKSWFKRRFSKNN